MRTLTLGSLVVGAALVTAYRYGVMSLGWVIVTALGIVVVGLVALAFREIASPPQNPSDDEHGLSKWLLDPAEAEVNGNDHHTYDVPIIPRVATRHRIKPGYKNPPATSQS